MNLDLFSIRLKQLRLDRELTLDMVAYDMRQKYNLSISKGIISKWENGVNLPTIYYAKYLALYFNVSLDYLVGTTDAKTPIDLLARKYTKEDKNG